MSEESRLVRSATTVLATVNLFFDAQIQKWKLQSERKGINYGTAIFDDEDEAVRAFKGRVSTINK